MEERSGALVIVGFMLGIGFAIFLNVINDYKSGGTIISHNCAQYNPKSGSFEWLDKQETDDVRD